VRVRQGELSGDIGLTSRREKKRERKEKKKGKEKKEKDKKWEKISNLEIFGKKNKRKFMKFVYKLFL
jgi:hypothetical protein